MKVRWTAEALKDLDEIEDFIAIDNPERAVTFIEERKLNGQKIPT